MAEGLICFGIPGSTSYKGDASLLQATGARLLGNGASLKVYFRQKGYFVFLLVFGVFDCRT